ncbi:tetratricopeptide repeat protein [candidate division KSB1 bacterium]|nr:tetratricopeptide repeat protein [candidate division KSB1 bacterium]
MLLKLSFTTKNDNEKKILATIEQVPLQERVRQILDRMAASTPADQRTSDTEHDQGFKKIIKNLEKYVRLFRRPQPGVALAFVVILVFVVYGFRYYQTTYQVRTAEKLLEQYHRIARNELRLAGDYAPSYMGLIMGDDADSSYVEEVHRKLNVAQKYGVKTSRIAKVQAHFLIMNKKYAQADSLLLSLESAFPTAAYNDLGVAAFQQGNIPQAIAYFERSLLADSTQAQPLYNLGLIYSFKEKNEQARVYLQKCLKYETDNQWRKFVRDKIDTIIN